MEGVGKSNFTPTKSVGGVLAIPKGEGGHN